MGAPASGRWVCIVEPGRGSREIELLPEAGRQPPPVATAGPVTVVLDGGLTDRDRLEAELGGAAAATDDATLILDGYRRIGDRVLSRISGTFALVIWDAEQDRLLCARDPIGIHPVLYARAGGTLAVASFVEPLLRHLGVHPRVDPVRTTLRIIGFPPGPEQTLLADVHKVPPGHALDATAAGTRLYRYWDPGEPGSETGLAAHEAAEQFDVLLRQAVDRCIGSEPAAVYLSGGLDSATVAAAAAAVSSRKRLAPPLGLALMIDDPDLDEESNQRAVAGDLGMELVPVSIGQAVGQGRLLRATLEVSASGTAGPADVIQPIYDVLTREGLRRGRETFMNGQGGDEWLLPSRQYGADRLRSLDLAALYQLWQALYRYLPSQSTAAFARESLWTWGTRPLFRAAAVRAGRSVSRVRDLQARRILERLPTWLAPGRELRQEVVEQALLAGSQGAQLTGMYRTSRRALLDRPDRPGFTEEAFATHRRLGARTVMPLLDAELVRFLYRLPPALLVHGGRAKALGRHVVAQRLPSFGGSWPRTVSGERYFKRLIDGEATLAWREAGGTPCLAQLGVVDESMLARLVESGASPRWIWSTTNIDVWLRSVAERSSG